MVDMNASANPSAVLSSSDGVRGKGLMGKTRAKPQQRFADVSALAGLKEETKPGTGTAGKATVHLAPESPQGAPETHKRSHRSGPDSRPAATGIGLSDQSAVLLMQPESNIAKTDSSSKPLLKRAGRKTEDGGQGTEDTEQKELSIPMPASGDLGTRISGTTPRDLGTRIAGTAPGNARAPSLEPADGELNQATGADPQSAHPALPFGADIRNPKGMPAAVHATGDRVAVRPDQAQAEVSQPVPAGLGRQAVPQPPTDGKEDPTASAEIEPAELEPKGQEVPAGESAERLHRTRAGGSETPTSAGAKAPFAPASVPMDRPSVPVANPDQAPSVAPVASRAATVQAPQAPRPRTAAPRTESQRTTPRREDAPTARNRSLEVSDSGDKGIPSAQRKENTAAPAESPASLAGQPAVAAPRLGPEAPMHKVAEVGATANPLRSVGEQILDSVRASATPGDREIVIRLQPPELGTVSVRLREQGDHLEGTIEVGKSDVRREIERALPDVVRGLQEAGVPIRRLDVTSSDSVGSDLGRGLPQQNLGAGQQGSGQHREPFPAAHTAWSQEATRYSTSSEEPTGAGGQRSVPPGRIDMLL
jgi:chemotaxis protein MotD